MSLVPYAARGALYAARNPYFRTAVRFSPHIKQAALSLASNMARRVVRKMRKRKRNPIARNAVKKARLRQRIGERVGSGNCKRNETKFDGVLNTRSLESDNLFTITQGTQIFQRLQDIVNLRGIRICTSFVLNTGTHTANGEKCFINMAVISPREDSLTGVDAVPTSDFFRGNDNNRHQDFSITLTALEFHCLPINTDKWNVHRHKRFAIGPYSSTEGRSSKMVNMYIKVNRQIRFEDLPTERPIKPMYLCTWADYQDKASGAVSISGTINWQMVITRYFREPKN